MREERTQHSRFTGGRSRRKPEAVLEKNGTPEGLATVLKENAPSNWQQCEADPGWQHPGEKNKKVSSE